MTSDRSIDNQRLVGIARLQLDWLWQALELKQGDAIYDLTCGPGLYSVALAERGCRVTGVDFSPSSIAHARQLALDRGVEDYCHFIEQDVRADRQPEATFDAALFLYGQLAVFNKEELFSLLQRIAHSLKADGRLIVELADASKIDETPHSSWWFTDNQGLWGDRPFIHLGERYWLAENNLSHERFLTFDLESGDLQEVELCHQFYTIEEMCELMRKAGFSQVKAYPTWDGLALYDADEWVVYIGTS